MGKMYSNHILMDGNRPLSERVTLSRSHLSLQGINFNFGREDISAPTDWRFEEPHHILVLHRAGDLRSMETVFSSGPASLTRPAVGDVWVIPAEHRYAALAQGNIVSFCELVIPIPILGNREILPQIARQDPFLHHNVERLASTIGREDDVAGLLRDTVATSIRLHLTDSFPLGNPIRRRKQLQLTTCQKRILADYIRDTLDAEHSLESMAAVVDIPIHQFLTAFTKAFGITPHQYLIRQRLTRARELLITSNAPITAIASTVGFANAQYFATSFKKNIGVTPNEYRNAGR